MKEISTLSQDFAIDCKCLILDERNRILLVKETEHWETSGGRLQEAETPTECIIREVGEELGAKLEIIDKLPIFIRKKSKNQGRHIDALVMYFLGTLLASPKLNMLKQKRHSEEILEVRWFTPNDLRNIPLNKSEAAQLYKILKEIDAK